MQRSLPIPSASRATPRNRRHYPPQLGSTHRRRSQHRPQSNRSLANLMTPGVSKSLTHSAPKCVDASIKSRRWCCSGKPNLIAKNQTGDLLLLSDFSKKFENLSISHFGTQLPSRHDRLCRSFSPNTNETNIYQHLPTTTNTYQ